MPAFWIFAIFLITFSVSEAMDSAPHVIIIVADDLGWGDVSFHGSTDISTPNIDALAKESVILNQYYVSPICTPSRSALLSGIHPIHTGMQHHVIRAGQPWALPLNLTLLPQYLKDLGYSTHAVGKWHLGFMKEEYTPTLRGFDSHFGYWCSHIDYYDHTAQIPIQAMDFRDNLKLVADKYFGDYATFLFNNKTVELISSHNISNPLFLYVSHIAVHAGNSYAPLQAPAEYVQRFPHIKDKRRRIFAGMLSALDDSVGNIIGALAAKGMLNNSIIVLTTDNGAANHGMDESAGSNWPLRGLKYTLWEGGVRGVAMIWSPMLLQKPNVYNHLMHISDWLPTIYHAAGGDPKFLGSIDGIDMWEAISRNLSSGRTEVLHNIDPIWDMAAIRVGEYKLVHGSYSDGQYDGWYQPPEYSHPINPPVKESSGRTSSKTARILKQFRSRHAKGMTNLVQVKCGPRPNNASTNCQPKLKPCLFHIPSDPCEFNNIAKQHLNIVQALLQRLQEYQSTAVPPRNKAYDPTSNPVLHGYAWVPWLDEMFTDTH